jgi:hypothetical protein
VPTALESTGSKKSRITSDSSGTDAVTTNSALQTARYLTVLLAGFIGGSRAVDAIRSWQEWHAWAARDPSGADAYKTFFMVNAASAALSLAIGALVWWLLRPRQ